MGMFLLVICVQGLEPYLSRMPTQQIGSAATLGPPFLTTSIIRSRAFPGGIPRLFSSQDVFVEFVNSRERVPLGSEEKIQASHGMLAMFSTFTTCLPRGMEVSRQLSEFPFASTTFVLMAKRPATLTFPLNFFLTTFL